MTELKPCPFCGGKPFIYIDPSAVVDTQGRSWAYHVLCTQCCAVSTTAATPVKAAEFWNRRADSGDETDL
ncbi:MAG: Lar family restriction alleviation protein [Oscillospiraceae bacterium]